MKVGFPISRKENERRRALLPRDAAKITPSECLIFEAGYGEVLGISDDDYRKIGASIASYEEVLKSDLIVDPKVGDADYLSFLQPGTSIFGWVHAVQNRDITDAIVNNRLTAYAWENMYEEGRHVFWRNNELAGEAAILHAFQCWGKMPYEADVAIIGRGNTARGAVKILNMLGARVMQYDRRTEGLLRKEIDRYDVIVNCVLWDVARKDHIISRNDLRRMKHGSMIVDVSCDREGGVETCIPTTVDDPVYYVDGVMHYAVDHTPALFHKTFSEDNSNLLYPYIQQLVDGALSPELQCSLIIDNGEIRDAEIIRYQNR